MTDTHVPMMPLSGPNKTVYVPTQPGERKKGLLADKLSGIIPARYLFAVLASISFAIVYGLKVNLSVAIVTMVNHTALQSRLEDSKPNITVVDACATEGETEGKMDDGPFVWSDTIQGVILGSYFWGYLVGQLPGGRLSELYSAKYVMLVAVALNIVGCLLTPVASYENYFIFIFMRVLQGFGGGLTFPAMHVLLSHWAPPAERSTITAIVYAGTSIGTVISTIMSGQVAHTMGWEWVFYLMGILSLVWCALWVWLIHDHPSEQVYITASEQRYIMESLGVDEDARHEKHPPVPWKKVFTSIPFYAILISHFCSNCGWYMLLTQLPSFMKQVLKFQIKKNALLSSVPYFCMWIFSMVLSKVMDTLRGKGKLSLTAVRKICTGLASVIPAICFIAIGYVGCNRELAVALVTISITFIGAMFCGFLANHIDIASQFSGTLMAITNTVATIPGITVPVLVGYLTEEDKSINQWRKVFLGTAAIYVFFFLVYVFFGSGEEQPWNRTETGQRQTATDAASKAEEGEEKEKK